MHRIEKRGQLVSNQALSIYQKSNQKTLLFWEKHCERLARLHGLNRKNFLRAVDGYIKYSFEFLKEQAFFLQKQSYRYNKFDTVFESIYSNEEVMESYYLDGLYLTLIFWPNHWRILRIFNNFLRSLPKEGRALDIGTGHGYYLARLLCKKPFWFGSGIDISPYACDYACRMLLAESISPKRFEVIQVDARSNITKLDNNYQIIIMTEIIEHVENPVLLIKNAITKLNKGGKIFFTTAVNSAAYDHIWLFKSTDEIKSMIRSSGLEISMEETIVLGSHKKAKQSQKIVPTSYVAVLKQKFNH